MEEVVFHFLNNQYSSTGEKTNTYALFFVVVKVDFSLFSPHCLSNIKKKKFSPLVGHVECFSDFVLFCVETNDPKHIFERVIS